MTGRPDGDVLATSSLGNTTYEIIKQSVNFCLTRTERDGTVTNMFFPTALINDFCQKLMIERERARIKNLFKDLV